MKQLLTALFALSLCVTAWAENPQIELEPIQGCIVIELDQPAARRSVKNFLYYVDSG